MSVQRAQPSIKRGQTATYVVQVSTKNGSASGVTVGLAAQPSSVRPKFSSGCAKDDGTASCSIASVTDKQAVTLGASVAVASNATSVASVKLTATASRGHHLEVDAARGGRDHRRHLGLSFGIGISIGLGVRH